MKLTLFARVRPLRSAFLGVVSALLLLVYNPGTAKAEKLLVDGVVSASSGLEGADPGFGKLEWQRQRLLVKLGAEWSNSETFQQAIGVAGLLELERSGAFGAEVYYRQTLHKLLLGHAGLIGILRPESLFGVNAGVALQIDIGDTLGVFADVSAAAFPLGSDRPHGSAVVIWVTGGLGVRLHF
jgi:hypothetical protein